MTSLLEGARRPLESGKGGSASRPNVWRLAQVDSVLSAHGPARPAAKYQRTAT
jgi:hypothetical protein